MAENHTPRAVGMFALACVIVTSVFAYVLIQRRLSDFPPSQDSEAIGTTGARTPPESSPGGFNPEPEHETARDELKFKGIAQITEADQVAEAAVGSSVSLDHVTVDRASGSTFWIRDGETTAVVVVPGGTPTVRTGQQVNVSGTIESAGSGRQIRASRIDVK